MEKTLSNSILYGRPFGGVAILINNIYSRVFKIHANLERFVIVTLYNIAFVKVYLPGCKTSNDGQVLADIFDEIKTI